MTTREQKLEKTLRDALHFFEGAIADERGDGYSAGAVSHFFHRNNLKTPREMIVSITNALEHKEIPA